MIRHKAIEQSGNQSRILKLTREFATAALLVTLNSAASNAVDATETALITGANLTVEDSGEFRTFEGQQLPW